MKFGSFRYLVKQGLKSIWVNRIMSVASVAILVACLFLTAASYLISANINRIVKYVEGQNQVVVVLYDEVKDTDRTELEDYFEKNLNVQKFLYVSKEQALKDSIEKYGSLMEGLEDSNPLPSTYVVTLYDLSKLDVLVDELEEYHQIEQISAPTDFASTLTVMKKSVSTFGTLIVAVLVAVSLIIISNTVRISVYNRRREVAIMRTVGATNGFIRLPFLVEGFVLGSVSGLICYILIKICYNYVVSGFVATTSTWVSSMAGSVIPFSEISFIMFLSFVVLGAFVGVIGSFLSVRRYLTD